MFDYEGEWGMPHRVPYDIERTTSRILEVLCHHDVRAMFFIVGRLVEERPDLVARIHDANQAIGIHGHRHERLYSLSPHALQALGEELRRVRDLVATITGEPPVAFRAPYLLAPRFVDAGLTKLLLELDFRWTSNRWVRFPEQLTRSKYRELRATASVLERLGLFDVRHPLGKAAFVAQNVRLMARDPDLGLRGGFHWLRGQREPILRAGHLYDIAVTAPLDVNFLGLPNPDAPSPQALVELATARMGNAAAHGGSPYTVTFHDWVIGSCNRLGVLDQIMGHLRETTRVLDARTYDPAEERLPTHSPAPA